MSYVYLCPITSQALTIGGQTVTSLAPKFFSLLTGAWTVIPYGEDGIGILTLGAANATIAAADDCYSFPTDLATQLADSDVTALGSFLAAANIPSDQINSTLTFGAALQIIAKIFMVAQALLGATGAPLFTNGTTLSSTIGDSDLAPLAPAQNVSQGVGQVGVSAPGGGGQSRTKIQGNE
jgi:hypothetical protein